jgi:hypothetical protein
MPLTYLDRTADTGAVAAALRRDGAVVVDGLAAPRLVDTIRGELRPELDSSGLEAKSDFNGSLTLRSNRVLSVAPSAAELVDHDMVVRVADELLLPHCATYQVGSLTAIEILPGLGRHTAEAGMAGRAGAGRNRRGRESAVRGLIVEGLANPT